MTPTDVLKLLNKQVKYPEQQKNIDRWKAVYYEMSLHTLGACPAHRSNLQRPGIVNGWYYPAAYYGQEYQVLFEAKLLNRHQRESEETRDWRYANYRPMTKAPFSRLTELVVGAIFQDGNYTLELPNKSDNDYIWGNNFHGSNLIGYISKVVYRQMVEDPNGFVLRLPKHQWNDPEKDGFVEVCFIHSKEIKYIDDDNIVFCYKDYAWHIDKQVIYRYEKNDKVKTYKPGVAYYAHMLGKLPLTVAGGEWNTMGYYDSFYDKAKAAADDFINTYSNAQLVDKEASYPYITQAADECTVCNGLGQIQRDCNECPGGSELITCSSCNNGKVASDPARRMIVPIEKMDNPTTQIVNPDVTINGHHREVVNSIMQLILDALHLTIVEEAQSGVAKAIDQDQLFKFISKISNHIFDNIVRETVNDIISYRNVSSSNGVLRPAIYDYKLVKPSSFQIKTARDLQEEYKVSEEAGMPDWIKAQQIYDYTDKQYSGNEVIKRKTEVILQMDKLSLKSEDAILNMKLAGSVTMDDILLNANLSLWLDKVIREKGDDWFIEAKYDDIEAEVKKMKPPTPPPSLNPMT